MVLPGPRQDWLSGKKRDTVNRQEGALVQTENEVTSLGRGMEGMEFYTKQDLSCGEEKEKEVGLLPVFVNKALLEHTHTRNNF